ncbi:YopX family protein [Leuconostoc citreum]|uniref:YopX family protein n=1 Tax=Leuconostoc citreum TaxID=33964 RepID=UPI0032E04902
MREIKFRAWNKVNKRYYQDVQDTYDETVGDSFQDVLQNEDLVVEQYAGLKDVNGIEIYEGDVLQPVRVCPDFLNIAPSKIGKAFLVKSGNYVFGKWIARLIGDKGYSVSDYYFGNELNIIGNIHEQPELLEDR